MATLGLGATVFSVGTLYGVLFGNELSQCLPYFAAGLIAWTFTGSTLSEGCGTFLGAAAIIRAVPVAPVLHVRRMLTRQLIMLAHNLGLMVILWFLFQWPLGWSFILIIPGLVLNTLVVFEAVLALSIIAARFRDIQLIVSTVATRIPLDPDHVGSQKPAWYCRALRCGSESHLSSH